jgi:hypothetical protein
MKRFKTLGVGQKHEVGWMGGWWVCAGFIRIRGPMGRIESDKASPPPGLYNM